MPLLYGKVNPLTNHNASIYTLFERLLLEDETSNKPAIITVGGGIINYGDLNAMVTSICEWLHNNLKSINESPCRMEGIEADILEDTNNTNCYYEDQKRRFKKDSKDIKFTKEKKDIIIAICMNRKPELIALIFAIWKLHLSFVPLDPTLSVKRTISSIQQTKPQLIVCDNQTMKGVNDMVHHYNSEIETLSSMEALENLSVSGEINKNSHAVPECNIINLKDCKLVYSQTHSHSEEVAAKSTVVKLFKNQECSCLNNLACIMFTSGCSDVPKGVKINTNNLINRITWQWNDYPYEKDDICLWSKPLTYLESTIEFLCPLLSGVPIVVPNEPTLTPELLLKHVAHFSITRLVTVPSFVKLLLDYLITYKESIDILKIVRLWITSGEALPNWLLAKFYEIFPDGKIANFYGCTEVTGDVTTCLLSSDLLDDSRSIPLGTPIQNTAIIIFKDEGNMKQVLENGNVGEIGVVGMNVCDGNVTMNDNKLESDCKFVPLNLFFFAEREEVRNFHKYLSDIRYFTGERYGIMEQTVSASTKSTHQTFMRCSRNESPDKFRKYSLVGGKSCDINAISAMDIKEHRKKTRALSICASSALPSSSYIVADEIELLNKFKGIKSFSEIGNLPVEKAYRRGSMPFAGSPPVIDTNDTRNLQLKSKFKPNIKTTAELVTTEVNKLSASTSGQSSSSDTETQVESFLQTSSMSVQHLSDIPDVSPSAPEKALAPSSPKYHGIAASTTNIETFHPIMSSTVSHTFYILKQISTLTKEKLAVHLTGDLGSMEDGVLYYHGRKDSQLKFKEYRLDPSNIDVVTEISGAI